MNWVQRFINAIATHKADASAHHAKTTDASELTSGALNSKDRLPDLSTGKIWQGNANRPAEVDPPSVPSGVIAIWHGTIANIPAGWVLCDGNSGTPSLLDRFVESVPNAATNPGATGGSDSKTTTGHVHSGPSHTHSGPSHTHTVPSHQHVSPLWWTTNSNEDTRIPDPNETLFGHETCGLSYVDYHKFTESSSTQPSSVQQHFLTKASGAGNTGASGTGATSASGTGNTSSKTDSIADIRPKYYDVAFIMKT